MKASFDAVIPKEIGEFQVLTERNAGKTARRAPQNAIVHMYAAGRAIIRAQNESVRRRAG